MKADDSRYLYVPRVMQYVCVPIWVWTCRLFCPEEKVLLVEIGLQSQGTKGFTQTDEWLAGLLSCDVALVAYLITRLKTMGLVREETGTDGGRVLFLTHGSLDGMRSAVAYYREQLVQAKAKELGQHLPKGQQVMREVAKQAADDALAHDLATHQDHIDAARKELWAKMNEKERRIAGAIKAHSERHSRHQKGRERDEAL